MFSLIVEVIVLPEWLDTLLAKNEFYLTVVNSIFNWRDDVWRWFIAVYRFNKKDSYTSISLDHQTSVFDLIMCEKFIVIFSQVCVTLLSIFHD
jgi:hypothetical protein